MPQALEDLILSCCGRAPGIARRASRDSNSAGGNPDKPSPFGAGAAPWWRRLRERRIWVPAAAALVATLAMLLLVRSLVSRSPPLGTALSSSTPSKTAGARQTVQMTFQSTPPGATVFREGDPRPLGVTPFAAEFELRACSRRYVRIPPGRLESGTDARGLLASGPVELALTRLRATLNCGQSSGGEPEHENESGSERRCGQKRNRNAGMR